ncbi:acetyl-CoA carboxylase carboxyltransferase subunit alpha [Aneurinibacillus aneurinilyticus]|jgi:acetyl-CoA carboxylase carboxyl transferase subunit alpha|uniref:Acetyl-coenzyme A carboxylase carboxyl transferase subunit alpha n=2 Tax=Aneurinibacillus aneurinilyticus TaxID=1391 RepID=A0A848D0H9_ANEAE|nr:acetyl-CoA carboxylase carboxyltransferase subunit alpha [Aneurinibacillus aneurinilyticus]ERI08605.1 acetyl-CoA carboxylase, carboxyl transferase, alpha subunit [Aneurinibacillus aneurinilyticus ATCC 12856]MCI1693526.1 acetyl-CoA carboxylase carboxyltransferase subunit alpha [Aneurinibacillus aneurinilyticus]MED0672371.1 acetyl-CoA carboxylase carboxyltransferase subunit alpha [Aneurinibacillus aneurinilyticus]MED0706131.1 acetyl-CoA carboxylase carboxyltransferase subunit alpha [Aneuriniba
MAVELPFEKPLLELDAKIEELRKFTQEKDIDFTDEIIKLEARAKSLAQEIYGNLTPWQRVMLARHPERPTTLDLIGELFTDFIELHGDRLYGEDAAIVGGIAKFNGQPVTVVGHQKGRDTKENIARNFGSPHPEGYRKALRLMQQADKFNRPIICFINTQGAYPGKAAEERGQSEAIARNLREMASFGVPILCVVTGEGGSGGAIALGVGNRLLMMENAFYSVISPEGAASILWKDSTQAQRAAESMKITANDLHELGVVDEIVPEPIGGAHRHLKETAASLHAALTRHLAELKGMSREELIEDRYEKYKAIGQYAALTESI